MVLSALAMFEEEVGGRSWLGARRLEGMNGGMNGGHESVAFWCKVGPRLRLTALDGKHRFHLLSPQNLASIRQNTTVARQK